MMITQVWSSFFNDLFGRVGGPTALSNADLQAAVESIDAISNLEGDVVTTPVTGVSTATATIEPNVVTNSKLAQMPAMTIKGNNLGAEANASDLTVQDVAAMLPSAIAFFQSPFSNTASALITSSTFVNFSNTPTLTFTPSVGGIYKVYASIPLLLTNAADNAQVRIQASSGTPTVLAQSIGNLSGASGLQSNQYVQSVFTLVAGNGYSFVAQGQCSSSAGCQVPAIAYYIFAERVAS